MKLAICFLLFFSSLSAQVLFQTAQPSEIPQLQNFTFNYFSKQLVKAGRFVDVNEAREVVEKIERTEKQKDETKKFFYYYLVSEDLTLRYGFLAYWSEQQMAYIDMIYLEKAYRGQGLGAKIFQELERSLKDNSIERIKFYVFDHNQQALKFYMKLGYEIEETYYQDDRPIGHFMTKQL